MSKPIDLPIEQQKPLGTFNTLGFAQHAEYFIETHSDAQIVAALSYAQSMQWPVFVLGGGSNIVLTRDIPGLTIHPTNTSITYDPNGNADKTRVTVGAGAQWQQLVSDTLNNNLQGLENLSLIPGSVGAAPVQNIGAYGVELQSRVSRVRALHVRSLTWQNFTPEQCEFSYRHSFFKAKANQYVITEVDFDLGLCNPLQYGYSSLAENLSLRGISHPTAMQISQSVIAVRQQRLPDPGVLSNAGSFFHNPVISRVQAEDLLRNHPALVTFDAGAAGVKISAAWMIEQLGFKGFKSGHVGVHDKQSLVLVHHGNGNGIELLDLATSIKNAVYEHFGIRLQIEPTVM